MTRNSQMPSMAVQPRSECSARASSITRTSWCRWLTSTCRSRVSTTAFKKKKEEKHDQQDRCALHHARQIETRWECRVGR